MCEWDDDRGGQEGVGAEADYRSSGRDVDCLLDTGREWRRENDRLSIQTELFVCSLEFGELERGQFVFQMDSSGGLGEQRVVPFLLLFRLIGIIFYL